MKTSSSLHHTLCAGLLVLALLLLTGCGAQATPVPTLDPVMIAGMAVQTMEARLTQAAIDNPSPTPLPTITPMPTNTPEPTATPTPEFTATPEATPTSSLSAKFLYATTYPENKRSYVSNERFSLALGFQNVGGIAWTSEYTLKMLRFTGEFTAALEVKLGKSIEPGQKAEFDLYAFGSEMVSDHTWVFQLYNENGIPVPGGVGSFSYHSN